MFDWISAVFFFPRIFDVLFFFVTGNKETKSNETKKFHRRFFIISPAEKKGRSKRKQKKIKFCAQSRGSCENQETTSRYFNLQRVQVRERGGRKKTKIVRYFTTTTFNLELNEDEREGGIRSFYIFFHEAGKEQTNSASLLVFCLISFRWWTLVLWRRTRQNRKRFRTGWQPFA